MNEKKNIIDQEGSIIRIMFIIIFGFLLCWWLFGGVLSPNIKNGVCYEHSELIKSLKTGACFIGFIASLVGIIFLVRSQILNKKFYVLLTIILLCSIVIPKIMYYSANRIADKEATFDCWGVITNNE